MIFYSLFYNFKKENPMNTLYNALIALVFLIIYVSLRKKKGSWIFLIFASLAPVVQIMFVNRFILNVPLVYGALCLWIAGMIVPFYTFKRIWLSIFYGVLNLLSLPVTILVGMQYGESAIQYKLISFLLILWLGQNTILLLRLMKNH